MSTSKTKEGREGKVEKGRGYGREGKEEAHIPQFEKNDFRYQMAGCLTEQT